MKYTLREYQKSAVVAGLAHLQHGKGGGVIVMPTGSGKSLVIASIATALPGHTLVFQPIVEILEQNYEKIRAFGFDDVGVFSASARRKDFGKITLATIGSVKNRRDEFAHFENIIVDEAHTTNANGGMYADFIKWSGGRLLGLTATPFRRVSFNDRKTGERAVVARFLHRQRPRLWESMIYITQVGKLVTERFWAPVEYHEATDYVHADIKLNSTGMDFDQAALQAYNATQGLAGKVARAVAAHNALHTLVFCVFVEEAKEVSTKLRELGISAATVSAETPKAEREQILADFKSGNIRVVTNVGVLTTGFDFPELDCVVLARPTQSVGLYYQMCYTSDMDILTDRGFLPATKINKGDNVFGFDKDTSEIRSVKVLDKVVRDKYNFEKVMQYRSARLDVGMSDYHDVISRAIGSKSKRWLKQQLREALQRKDMWEVPVAGYQKPVGKNTLRDCDLNLLGWFLSDGSITKRGVVQIRQSMKNKKYVDDIEKTLIECGIGYGKYVSKRTGELSKYQDSVNFVFCKTTRKKGKQGYSYIQKFFDKNMGQSYESLTREQLWILFSAIIKGDGCNKTPRDYKVATHTIACGSNKVYADRLQSLLVRRGYKANITTYKPPKNNNWQKNNQYLLRVTDMDYSTIAGSNSKDGSISGKKRYKRTRFVEDKKYKDKLWCIANELGTVIVRRNGKVMIAGNCGRGVRIAPGKKNVKIIDLCGNVAKFGKIEEFEIVEPKAGLHRLKSGVGYLTGVDFIGGADLEERDYKGYKEGSSAPVGVMMFGKFKGRHITKLPNDYLVWAIKNFNSGKLKTAFETEAKRRSLPAKRFEPIQATLDLPF